MKNLFEGTSKKSNMTTLEVEILRDIESYHELKKMLSEQIDRAKKDSEVLELKGVLKQLEEDYVKNTIKLEELDSVSSSKN